MDLIFCNHKRGSQPDLIAMRRLCQQAIFFHSETKVPGCILVNMFNNNRVQQAFAPYACDMSRAKIFQLCTEQRSHCFGMGDHLLFLQHLQCGGGNCAGEGIAAVGGAMFAWLDAQHDLIVAKYGAYRQHTTAQGFAQ